MADSDNPLKNLPDLPDALEELITLSTDPQKMIAKKAGKAYWQASLVTATAIPLLTLGGPTSISQAPIRKPDMEAIVSSASQVTLEGSIMLEAVETSAGSAPFAYRLVQKVKKSEST